VSFVELLAAEAGPGLTVVQDVLDAHAAVGADLVVVDDALVEELDQMGP